MIKKLLGIRLRGTFMSAVGGKDKRGNPKPISKSRFLALGLVYAFLGLVFLALIFTFAVPMAMILLPLGGENLYFGIFMLLSLSVVFIFSIFETKTELYDCKDNELLLSMPIRPRDIVISRICAVLIYNYIEELILMLPVVICYIIFGGSIYGVLGSLFVFLTLPLIATSLASGVGYAVHLLSHKLARFKNLMVMLLSVGFLVLYFVGYTALMENMEKFIENLETNYESIAENYSFVALIGSVATLKIVPTLVYTLIFASITLITVYVISRKYIGLMTATVKSKKVVYVAKELRGKSTLFALMKKEFFKFLSSPTYMLNGALGYLFQIAAAVFIAVLGPQLFELDPQSLSSLGMSQDEVLKISIPIFISILVFTESMVMMSVSSVSLEGKNLWILKSMPIPEKTVLLAKAMPQIILSVAFSAVSGLIAAIGIGAGIIESLFFILIPSAFGVFSSFMGIIINVLLPKLDFVNEVQVIKQSSAAFISMLANMLIGIVMIVVSVISMGIPSTLLVLLLIFLALVGFSAALYAIIAGPIAKRFSTF